MTKQEFDKKRDEINRKLWEDSQKVFAEMKNNGIWMSSLSSDPPEIQKLKDEAFAELQELAKEIEE